MEIVKSSETPSALELLKRQGIYTISELLSLYRNTVKDPEKNRKYLSYPKAYLHYCAGKNIIIGAVSMEMYLKEKEFGKSVVSILKRFLRFCEANNIFEAIADTKEKQRSSSQYVLMFLASVDLKSQNSKKSYSIALEQFYKFLGDKGLTFSLVSLNQYLQHLISEGKSSFTINQYLSAIKKYVQWVLNEDFITKEFTDLQAKDLLKILDIKTMKIKKGTYWKDSLDKEQRDLLLKSTPNIEERLILSLQVCEGLRPSEPAKIRLKDIDFERKTLKIQGKGKHTQDEIKIFGYSLELLKKHIEAQKISRPDSLLFPSLRYWHVHKIFTKAIERIGLSQTNKKLSPHSLRHTASQILTIDGVRPEYVQKQMRHTDIQTTQVYLEKIKEKLFISELPEMV